MRERKVTLVSGLFCYDNVYVKINLYTVQRIKGNEIITAMQQLKKL